MAQIAAARRSKSKYERQQSGSALSRTCGVLTRRASRSPASASLAPRVARRSAAGSSRTETPQQSSTTPDDEFFWGPWLRTPTRAASF